MWPMPICWQPSTGRIAQTLIAQTLTNAKLSLQRHDGGNPQTPRTEADYWQAYDWDTLANANSLEANLITGPGSAPRYVIEHLPAQYSPVPGSSNNGIPAIPGVETIRDYLITARGTGITDDAVVILQSRYRVVYQVP